MGQGRGRSGHALSAEPRVAPPAPSGLSKAERKAWRELWRSPVSALWTEDDHHVVIRVIRLRARIDNEGVDAPVTLYSQTLALEDRLMLSPRSRRQAGIVIVGSDPARESNGRPTKAERERLLRG